MSPLLYQLSYTATRLNLLKKFHWSVPPRGESVHQMPTGSPLPTREAPPAPIPWFGRPSCRQYTQPQFPSPGLV